MPTVPVHTVDTGAVYTGPYPYRRGLGLLVYGTVYGTGVARKTRSVLRLYGRKYGISFWQQRWLYRHVQSSFLPPCSVPLNTLYFVYIPLMISPRPRPQNIQLSDPISALPDSEFPGELPYLMNICVKQSSSTDIKNGITWAKALTKEIDFFSRTALWVDSSTCSDII